MPPRHFGRPRFARALLSGSATFSAGLGLLLAGPAIADPPPASTPSTIPSLPTQGPVGFPSGSKIAAPDTLNLDDLMRVAMQQSPLLRARDADRRAALERVPQAGALPDPELTWEFRGAPRDDPAPSEARENNFLLTQRFPFPGKRGLQRAEAAADADAAGASLDAARLEVATQLRKSFYHLHHLYVSIESLEESRDAMNAFAEIAKQRYEVGKSPQQDLLKAYVELATEEARLAAFHEEIPAVCARINAILGRDPTALLGPPVLPEQLTPPERVEDLFARAVRRSPALRAAEAKVTREESAVGVAKKSGWPDLTLGAGYMVMHDEEDAWMGTAGLSLPIWRGAKVGAARRGAEATLTAAQAEGEQTRRDLAASVREARAAVVAAQTRAQALEDPALTRAEQSFEATRFEYENGRASFLDLLDAQRTLLALHLEYAEAFMDALMAEADLSATVGDPPPGVPNE